MEWVLKFILSFYTTEQVAEALRARQDVAAVDVITTQDLVKMEAFQ